jgi:hypothetical protein
MPPPLLMGPNPLLGPLEWQGPENLDFLGPNGTRFARGHFRAQISLDFQGPALPTALVMDSPAFHLIPFPLTICLSLPLLCFFFNPILMFVTVTADLLTYFWRQPLVLYDSYVTPHLFSSPFFSAPPPPPPFSLFWCCHPPSHGHAPPVMELTPRLYCNGCMAKVSATPPPPLPTTATWHNTRIHSGPGVCCREVLVVNWIKWSGASPILFIFEGVLFLCRKLGANLMLIMVGVGSYIDFWN